MRATDYVITPMDVWRGIRSLGWLRAVLLVLVCAGSVWALSAGKSAELVLLGFSICSALLLRVDSRLPFVAAIVLLIGIAALSVFDPSVSGVKNTPQERLAVLVYYCLVLGVVLLIQEQVAPQKAAVSAPAVQTVPLQQTVAIPRAAVMQQPITAPPAATGVAAMQPMAPMRPMQSARHSLAPAAQQLHRVTADAANTAARMGMRHAAARAIATPGTIGASTQRLSVDGVRPMAPSRLAPQPAVASRITAPVTVAPQPIQSVMQPQPVSSPHQLQGTAAPHIRRATRRSIDGFIVRQSPAARVSGQASQFAGA